MVDGSGGSTNGLARGLSFPLPFIGAAFFTPLTPGRPFVDLIVLHSMESQEKPQTARNVAKWFAGATSPLASAHYCVDADEVIQCVSEHDVAWHAPGVNSRSIGIEHAGKASQTEAEWRDEFSMSTLHRSIELSAVICKAWGIPAKVIDAAGLIHGERGITTHAEVSKAFHKSDHWDPGPGFPFVWYAERVASILSEVA